MSDDLLNEFMPELKNGKCIVGKFFDGLSATDQEKLTAALSRSDISNIGITNWSKDRGGRFSRDSVRIHRVGECCCD